MAKKIFIISGIIFVVVLGTLLVYKFFVLQENSGFSDVIKNPFASEQANTPETGKISRLSKVVEKTVKGATLAQEGTEVIYYENQNFVAANFDGTGKRSVGAYPFSKVEYIQWHPKKNQVILKDAGKFLVFDLQGKSTTVLKEVDVAIWDSYGEKIVYKYYDKEQGKRKIAFAQADGSAEQVLFEDVPFAKVELLAVPKSNEICYFPTPEANTKSKLVCIDIRSKEQTELDSGLRGADYLWSPNGKKILVSYLAQEESNKLTLATMSRSGGEFTGLKFFTSASKCVWSNDSEGLFCGVLTDLPEHAVLPNDWASEKYYSTDTFWKLNLDDGKKQRIFDLEEITGKIDAVNFFLDKNEKNLFFTDRQSGNLYRVRF